MKKITLIAALIVVAVGVLIAGWNQTVFNKKAIATSTTRTDTSSTYSLRGVANAELQTSINGTDSAKILIAVDGLFGAKWVAIKYDTLIADNAVTNLGRGTTLRGYGTNNIPGVEYIRIRNTVTIGGTDDSSSATSYSQFIVGR